MGKCKKKHSIQCLFILKSLLAVTISFAALRCTTNAGIDMRSCIIIGNTVTGICNRMVPEAQAVPLCTSPGATVTPVAATHTSISGTLSKNLRRPRMSVMANWSRTMWQDVVNRALRMLASGPFCVALLLRVGHGRRQLKLIEMLFALLLDSPGEPNFWMKKAQAYYMQVPLSENIIEGAVL
ncbi:hypothetical protein KIN20_019208 [Parelaphostrongylus tenuis]|uniref:Uncharacterized protein n=1 Tax=Parelaphostrongylus tenuis TaxID=148309 RepID=A0AAD5QST2_PARTN|nr:hypothetical protein KIN20_019208 [Parelaphostrongylus tenuis]